MKERRTLPQIPDYEIDPNGNVFSKITGKYMKQYLRKDGYMQVGLLTVSKTGQKKMRSWLVHRLVSLAFIENPSNLSVVNHRDGNKTNNSVTNLEWCTVAENVIHARRTGLRVGGPSRKAIEMSIEVTRRPIIQISRSGEIVRRWSSVTEASASTGATVSAICAACKRTKHTAAGYLWCYEDDANGVSEALESYKNGYGRKPVYQYSLSGDLIKKWNSIADVERETGYRGSSITSACKGRIKQSYGFIWSREEKEQSYFSGSTLLGSKRKNRPVLQFSKEGEFIKKWPSATEAARKFGFDSSSISKACRGKTTFYKGFIWKFSEAGL